MYMDLDFSDLAPGVNDDFADALLHRMAVQNSHCSRHIERQIQDRLTARLDATDIPYIEQVDAVNHVSDYAFNLGLGVGIDASVQKLKEGSA